MSADGRAAPSSFRPPSIEEPVAPSAVLILGGSAFGGLGPLVRALTEVIHVNPPGGASELRRRV